MFTENLLYNSQALFQGHYVETHLILRVQTRKLRPREASALAQSLPALMMRPWNQTHTVRLLQAALPPKIVSPRCPQTHFRGEETSPSAEPGKTPDLLREKQGSCHHPARGSEHPGLQLYANCTSLSSDFRSHIVLRTRKFLNIYYLSNICTALEHP